ESGALGLALEAPRRPVAAHHREPERGIAGARERGDGGLQPLAGKPGADEEEHHVARPAAELGARRAAQTLAQARMEMLEVHAAVAETELARIDAERAPDLVEHHARVADDRAQARMLEHFALGRAD